MVKPMHEQSPSVKLLTILNVQSAKPPSTKKRSPSSSAETPPPKNEVKTRDWHSIASKAKKVKLAPAPLLAPPLPSTSTDERDEPAPEAVAVADQTGDDDDDDQEDSFKRHFGATSPFVDQVDKDQHVEGLHWDKKRTVVKGLGECQLFASAATADVDGEHGGKKRERSGLDLYAPKMLDKLRSTSTNNTIPAAHENWLSTLSTYRDVSYSKLELGEKHDEIRSSVSLHAMNHVLKTRSRILKNNEYLSKIASNPSLTQPSKVTTDQGFTRPKVLILAPFRSAALSWVQHVLNYSLVPQIENYERFLGEYSLPEGVTDKLVERADEYPLDHVETFRGNIDDSFRVGLKVNRKQVKVFSEFYQADIIVASPLGLRTSIEKEDDSDFLSSIEMVIVDQLDVMLMQNWDHVNFVMERLNHIPEQDHGCDFSRVKPWYLDGKARYLRQSILLSRYSTPETLSLFSTSLHNQAGKLKTVDHYEGVMDQVPRGLKQVWNRFECESASALDDKRFEWFTQKTLPSLMKSAISSQQTIIFIPDYFDFIRVKRYLTKKLDDFSFTSISEYTPTPDVSRARGLFFSGKKKFLVVTERFHFFRRYRLRGAKTVVFYAPPSHPDYYPEVLSFPFTSASTTPGGPLTLDPDVEVDESELSAHVVFSKFDLLRLERIVGTKDARRMCNVGAAGGGGGGGAESRFTFV
ncbi:hypothetical protein JCM11491_007048 [Sporobolomyces phaffii]